ncbi:MAG: fatty acid desaturase [Desulfobacterales bacterium]|nr:fatty acid desaturase [Desulfobacterales bacterium]
MISNESNQANNNEKKSPQRTWPDWYPTLKSFRRSDNRKAIWQLINTLIPYGCIWCLMIRSIQLGYSYTLTLVLALLSAAFLVRAFILFHDCVHNSFFKSKRVNTFFGYLIGILVFTSFEDWRFTHLRHHGTYANLDTRGFGDIWTMTLTEYKNLTKKKQMIYRLYRHPLVLIGFGALFNFLLHNRLPDTRVERKERMSTIFTNLFLLIIILLAIRFIGWQTYLLIQLPVMFFAGVAGIWLFYVQHQFKGVYWARKNSWDPLRAAMEGSSYFRLPAVLRWFSGNIGFHHIHHLNPRIPNYNLKKCYDAVPALHAKAPLTIMKSFYCTRLKLWDEMRQKMVGFP